jgi:hypothetical protein
MLEYAHLEGGCMRSKIVALLSLVVLLITPNIYAEESRFRINLSLNFNDTLKAPLEGDSTFNLHPNQDFFDRFESYYYTYLASGRYGAALVFADESPFAEGFAVNRSNMRAGDKFNIFGNNSASMRRTGINWSGGLEYNPIKKSKLWITVGYSHSNTIELTLDDTADYILTESAANLGSQGSGYNIWEFSLSRGYRTTHEIQTYRTDALALGIKREFVLSDSGNLRFYPMAGLDLWQVSQNRKIDSIDYKYRSFLPEWDEDNDISTYRVETGRGSENRTNRTYIFKPLVGLGMSFRPIARLNSLMLYGEMRFYLNHDDTIEYQNDVAWGNFPTATRPENFKFTFGVSKEF